MFDCVLNMPVSLEASYKMAPLKSLFCNIYVVIILSFVFENENITLRNIWLLISQDLHSFINSTYITPLFNIVMFKDKSNLKTFSIFKNGTKTCEIANLYSRKSLFSMKHSQWEEKLKTCQEWPDLVCGYFIKVFYKTNTCPRQPLLSGPKSVHLI